MTDQPKAKAFSITDGKGFHVRFANGVIVSVQWGYGNYSDNYDNRDAMTAAPPSATAEVAVWDATGWLLPDDVEGYVGPEDVASLMHYASEWKPGTPFTWKRKETK